MALPRPGLAVAVLLAGVLAGCSSNSGIVGKAFDPIAVPEWRSGYSWTYDLASSFHLNVGKLSEADGSTGQKTLTVFNTTEPFLGSPAYYVRAVGQDDFPWDAGATFALRQSDLSLLGSSGDVAAVTPETLLWASSSSMPFEVIRCDPLVELKSVPEEGQLRLVRFPLDDGHSWSGALVGNAGFLSSVDYKVEVNGLVPVTVKAGTFEAVYITVDFEPRQGAFLGDDEFQVLDFDARGEYWYNPDVGNFVKSILRVGMHGADLRDAESGAFGVLTTMELVSYSQNVEPEEPAPIARSEDDVDSFRPFQIVTDQDFPANVSTQPVAARFGLEEGGSFTDGFPYGTPRRVESVPATLEIDHERFEVVWRVQSSDGYYNESRADVLETAFAEGGGYLITARIESRRCGESWLGSTRAVVTTFWERSWHQNIEPGLTKNFLIGSFPVGAGSTKGIGTFSLSQSNPYRRDGGTLQITGPHGTVASTSSPYSFDTSQQGPYSAKWQSDTVTVGDDLDLTIRIDYDYTGTVFAR